jgi:predicted SnoaL-like aldol condensation-catalyzing enzyme
MMRPLSRIACLLTAGLLSVALAAPSAAETSAAQQEANRQTVLDFYQKALNEMDADGMLAYLGSRYVNHNPNVQDGPEGFRKYIIERRQKSPHAHSDIKRSFVDGDYVILHVHTVREPGSRGNAIVDIFKLENGKIVEHWDVVQPIPEQAANENTMF